MIFKHNSTEILQTDELQFIEKQFKEEIRQHLNSPHVNYISTFEELKAHSQLPDEEAIKKIILLMPGCKIEIPESVNVTCKHFIGNDATISTLDSVEGYGLSISAAGVIEGICTESPEGCKWGQPNSERKVFIGYDKPTVPPSGPFEPARFRSEIYVSSKIIRNCKIKTNSKNRIGMLVGYGVKILISHNYFETSSFVVHSTVDASFCNNVIDGNRLHVLMANDFRISNNSISNTIMYLCGTGHKIYNNDLYSTIIQSDNVKSYDPTIIGSVGLGDITVSNNLFDKSSFMSNISCNGDININNNTLRESTISYMYIDDPTLAPNISRSINNTINISDNFSEMNDDVDDRSSIFITNFAKKIDVINNSNFKLINYNVNGVDMEELNVKNNINLRIEKMYTLPEISFSGIKRINFINNEIYKNISIPSYETMPLENEVLVKFKSDYCNFINNDIKLQINRGRDNKYNLFNFDNSIKQMAYINNTIQSSCLTDSPVTLPELPSVVDSYHNTLLTNDVRENYPITTEYEIKCFQEDDWIPDESYQCGENKSLMLQLGSDQNTNKDVSCNSCYDFILTNRWMKNNRMFIGSYAALMTSPDESCKGRSCFYGLEIAANDSCEITLNCVKGINQFYSYRNSDKEKKIERTPISTTFEDIENKKLRLLTSYDKTTKKESVCIIQCDDESIDTISKITSSTKILVPVMQFDKSGYGFATMLTSILGVEINNSTSYYNKIKVEYEPKTYKIKNSIYNYNENRDYLKLSIQGMKIF